MKENIYNPNRSVRLLIKRLLFIAGSVLITMVLPAQQQGAHNIQNVNTNLSKNNPNTTQGTITTVKTLSTLPGVTPRQNSVSETNIDNTLNIYSPATTNSNGSFRYDVNLNNNRSINTVNAGNLLLSNTSAKISSFTGESDNGEYKLAWETVMENDVKQYDVEYSLNNKDFEGAGIVNASNRTVYTFNHRADARAIIYYRLKVTDLRGMVSYTNPIMVKSTMAKPADLVSPTIIRDGVLNITLANTYKNIQLFNSAGVEVFREYLGGRTGNRIGFNLPDLPAGPYFVKLIGTNASVTQRVMIM
ncbi:T9SS type A sorting domain-containing protein [Flavitalea sp.]|nr:T9SS type A sorting domain-containing protein [Flavitalea sp.]